MPQNAFNEATDVVAVAQVALDYLEDPDAKQGKAQTEEARDAAQNAARIEQHIIRLKSVAIIALVTSTL
ncbi:hypothetical protein SAMN05443662_1425 [Sulfurivirga caldicuralii]|uniref:Uncharacterized protein n=2 Tax=Sulfurivirga caldicuralii TaxID=364032 RepID=A0A1N6GNT3_9GAMM|nr:hypothetical protein SAMN05443662_1425 [Sulfurivirga caldicuralii]